MPVSKAAREAPIQVVAERIRGDGAHGPGAVLPFGGSESSVYQTPRNPPLHDHDLKGPFVVLINNFIGINAVFMEGLLS